MLLTLSKTSLEDLFHQKKGFPSQLTLPIDADDIQRDGKIEGPAFTPSPFSPTYFLGLGSSAGLM